MPTAAALLEEQAMRPRLAPAPEPPPPSPWRVFGMLSFGFTGILVAVFGVLVTIGAGLAIGAFLVARALAMGWTL